MQLHKLLIFCLLCCLPAFAFGQTIKLQQLEPSATVEGTKAGQLGLTGTSGRQQYAQYTEVNGTPVGYIPAATGNTNNLSEFVTGSDGNKYYIDWQGNGIQIGGGGGSITPINGVTSITTPSVGTGLGGTLIKNTLIDGNQFSFEWTDLFYWRSNSTNTVSGGEVDLLLQPVGTSSILRGRVDHNGASGSNRRGELQLNPVTLGNDGTNVYLGNGTSLTTWSNETATGTGAGVSIGDDEAQLSYIDYAGGAAARAYSVSLDGFRMIGIDAATASKMLYFNPTTNEVTQGDPPAASGDFVAYVADYTELDAYAGTATTIEVENQIYGGRFTRQTLTLSPSYSSTRDGGAIRRIGATSDYWVREGWETECLVEWWITDGDVTKTQGTTLVTTEFQNAQNFIEARGVYNLTQKTASIFLVNQVDLTTSGTGLGGRIYDGNGGQIIVNAGAQSAFLITHGGDKDGYTIRNYKFTGTGGTTYTAGEYAIYLGRTLNTGPENVRIYDNTFQDFTASAIFVQSVGGTASTVYDGGEIRNNNFFNGQAADATSVEQYAIYLNGQSNSGVTNQYLAEYVRITENTIQGWAGGIKILGANCTIEHNTIGDLYSFSGSASTIDTTRAAIFITALTPGTGANAQGGKIYVRNNTINHIGNKIPIYAALPAAAELNKNNMIEVLGNTFLSNGGWPVVWITNINQSVICGNTVRGGNNTPNNVGNAAVVLNSCAFTTVSSNTFNTTSWCVSLRYACHSLKFGLNHHSQDEDDAVSVSNKGRVQLHSTLAVPTVNSDGQATTWKAFNWLDPLPPNSTDWTMVPDNTDQGASLVAGDMFYNTTANVWKYYNGSAWVPNRIPDGDYGDITVGTNGTTMTIDNSAITNIKIADGTIQPAKFAQSTAVDGSAYYYASTAWTIGTNVQSVRRITQNGTGSTVNVNNDNFESYQIDGTFSNNWNLTWTFTPGGGTTGTQALNPIRYVANLSTTQPFTLARGTGPTWQFKDISGAAAANSMTVSPGKKYQLVYDAAANLVRVTMIN